MPGTLNLISIVPSSIGIASFIFFKLILSTDYEFSLLNKTKFPETVLTNCVLSSFKLKIFTIKLCSKSFGLTSIFYIWGISTNWMKF